MALLQNKRIIYQTPGFFFGGKTINEVNSFVKNYRGRFIGETFDKKASMPLGTEGRFAYVLAQKGGGLATYTDISGSGTLTASQSNGINIESNLEGSSSLTANANLITSMFASLVGSGALSASMVGTVQLASELIGSGDVVGGLKMFAGLSSSLNGSGSLDGTMKGWANMGANIYVNQSETTVKQLVDGVWNAVASEYNNPGTMGEATQTGGGGGGGGATAAQIWSYSNRTLTEAAGLTPEQAIQLESASNSTKWSDIIDDNDDVVGSFGNKFAQYGGVSHVIDRSTFDDESKKSIQSITDKLESVVDTLKESPKVETKYIESTREIVKIEKVMIPSTESKALAKIIIKGLKELSATLTSIIVKGLIEIKNNK